MNRAYSLVWSDRLQCYAVASETTRRRGKSGGLKPLAAVLLSISALTAQAQPQGGVISAGSGSIATAGVTTTITQTTPKIAINWQNFSTAANESVVFQQPDASAIALNRVLGTESSSLLGSLTANGQVWILNPNGVMFGAGSQVNVGGLLATTLQISDDDFMAGKRSFSGIGGLVTNKGNITTTDGGYVALLGGKVSNEGVIAARLGTVALAAGNSMTLDFAGDKLLNVQVDQGALNALAQNKQLIQADGGTVLLTARGVDTLFNAVVNNDGVIEARTIGSDKGKITLLSDMKGGTTTVAGRLDASAPNGGDGGFIETSGATVKITDGVFVSTYAPAGQTGQWLIDPNDYTIAASGGDITGATLSANLATNNVSIETATQGTAGGNGDIFVNDGVSWTTDTKLSLVAERNVNVNADITATGKKAGLVMTPGAGGSYALQWGSKITLSGSEATLNIADQEYTLIHDIAALQNMQMDLGGRYALGDDVDASATSGWNGGSGFNPVGPDTIYSFNGTLDGLGHVVSKLVINTSADYAALFGINSGTIRNLGLVNADVTGRTSAAIIAGQNYGSIDQVYTTGKVIISDTNTQNYAGGLVGDNGPSGKITNAYSTADVTANVYVGGLVGFNAGILNYVFATGSVSGSNAGGLVGTNTNKISNAYASGNVNGTYSAGGLVGINGTDGAISQSYASGAVSSANTDNYAGILVGYNDNKIIGSYASGTLTKIGIPTQSAASNSNLVGLSSPVTENEISPLNSAQAKQVSSYNGFDFDKVWRIYEGNTTPLLRSLLIPLTVTANNTSKTYDGQKYTGIYSYTSSKPSASLSGSATIQTGSALNAVDAGSYTVGLGGLYSDRYDISYNTNGTLTVNPKPLMASLTGTIAKVYDGNTSATLSSNNFSSLIGLVGQDSITFNQTNANFSTANAGTSIPVMATLDSFTAAGNTRLTNYVLPTSASGTGQITQAPLQITANNAIRTYNGTAFSGGNGVTYSGFVNGETASVLSGVLSYSGNAQGAVNAGTYAITPAGLSASPNYAVNFVNGNLVINPKQLFVGIIGTPTKVYDGNNHANLTSSNYWIAGLVGTDTVRINQTQGSFNSSHVNTTFLVNARLSSSNIVAGAGTLATNYLLPTQTFGFGFIKPATLTYRADLLTQSSGSSIPTLTGSVIGFVNGDNLSNATTGTAVWKTNATSKSSAGKYAIEGSGLTANYGDYKFVQAASNATALSITCTAKSCQ